MEGITINNLIPEIPKIKPKPCMSCQFGIFDVPKAGKLNCFEAGISKIKILTKEEVEDMMFCNKMEQWTKMDLVQGGEKENSDLELVDRLLGNRHV